MNKLGANTTLTAKWDSLSNTIHFDGNGATSGQMGDQVIYTDDTNPTPLNANQYAKTYTVSYNSNGGSVSPASKPVNAEFIGWEDHGSMTHNGTVWSYSSFDAPFYANAHTDLMAAFGYNKFNLLNHYVNNGRGEGRPCTSSDARSVYPDKASVAYLADPGGETTLVAQWGEATEKVALPSPGVNLGYTFTGWYNGDTRVGGEGDSYTVTGTVTLTAHWSLISYVIKYYDEDGTTLLKTSDPVTYGDWVDLYTTDRPLTLSFTLNEDGSSFVGSYDSAGGKTYTVNSKATPDWIDLSPIVYWDYADSDADGNMHKLHTRTYNASGADGFSAAYYGGTQKDILYAKGQISTPPEAYSADYVDKHPELFGFDKVNILSHYVQYYYKYTDYQTKNIPAADDTNVYAYPSDRKVRNLSTTGGEVELKATWVGDPVILPSAEYSGHGFAGWKDTATNKVYSAGETIYPTADMNLVATWSSEPRTLTLNFRYDTLEKVYTKAFMPGTSLADYLKQPGNDEFGTFLGWREAGYTGSDFIDTANYTMPDKDVTLEAFWSNVKVAPYTIRLKGDGGLTSDAKDFYDIPATFSSIDPKKDNPTDTRNWVKLDNPFTRAKYTVTFKADASATDVYATDSVNMVFDGWLDNNPIAFTTWADGSSATAPVVFSTKSYSINEFNPIYYAEANTDVKYVKAQVEMQSADYTYAEYERANGANQLGFDKYAFISHYFKNGIGESRSPLPDTSDSKVYKYPDHAWVRNLTTTDAVVEITATWKDPEDTTITLPAAPTDASGRVFAGWYDENGKFAGKAGDDYTPTKDVTLTAHWGNTVTYGIHPDSPTGSCAQITKDIDGNYYFFTSDPDKYSLIHSEAIAINPVNGRWIINGKETDSGLDSAAKALAEDGYRVEGWYDNGQKIGDYSDKYITSSVVNNNEYGWGACTVWPRTYAEAGTVTYSTTELTVKFTECEVKNLNFVGGFDGSVSVELPNNVEIMGVSKDQIYGSGITFRAQSYGDSCKLDHGSAKVVGGTALYLCDPANPGKDTFYYSAHIPGEQNMTDQHLDSKDVGTPGYGVPEFKPVYRWATVTVIPATEVYYDDSIGDIEYEGTWSIVSANSNNMEAKDAQKLAESPYGHPESCTTYFLGSAHKATVSAATTKNPTATFEFTGTGFDIISLTNNRCGAVVVTVDGTMPYIVNNYRGYSLGTPDDGAFMKYTWTYSDGGVWHVKKEAVAEKGNDTPIPDEKDWIPGVSTFTVYEKNYAWSLSNSGENDNHYQIPVIKISGLAYGKHTVTIEPRYYKAMDKTGQDPGQYDFYLDSIRIYDPMGDNGAAFVGIEGHEDEAYPRYISLRQQLLSNKDYQEGKIQGVAMIDGIETESISDYSAFGSNNEIYLQPDQALVFTISGSYDSVWLGFKALNAPVSVTVGTESNNHKFTTQSTVDYYRDITNYISNGTVTISNSGDAPVSLTTLKVCGAPVMLSAPPAAISVGSKMLRSVMMAKAPAPFEPTVSVDAPETVTVGDKLTVKVTTSDDVAYITVNGVKVTENDSFVWTYEITADEAGTLDIEVMVFNDKDMAADNVQTASVTVNEKPVEPEPSVIVQIFTAISDFFEGLFKRLFG